MATSPQVQQQQETVAWVQHIERCFARHPLILRGQSIANFIDANYQSSTIGCATTHLDYLDDLGLPQVHQYLQDKLDLTTMHYVVLFFNKSTPSTRPILAQHQNQSLGAVAKKGVLVRDLQALRDIKPRYVRLLYLSQPEDMVGGNWAFKRIITPSKTSSIFTNIASSASYQNQAK